MAFAPRGMPSVSYANDGIALVIPAQAHGHTYAAWSVVRHPSPERLARSKPDYPMSILCRQGRVRPAVRFAWPRSTSRRDDRSAHACIRPAVRGGEGDRRSREKPVRGRRRDRIVAARQRTVLVRRTPAAVPGAPPLVSFVTRDSAWLLPALRRRDGAHAAIPGHPRACRGRVREWDVLERPMDRDRPRRAHVGGGLVRRLRMAAVRPDARARAGSRARIPPLPRASTRARRPRWSAPARRFSGCSRTRR